MFDVLVVIKNNGNNYFYFTCPETFSGSELGGPLRICQKLLTRDHGPLLGPGGPQT